MDDIRANSIKELLVDYGAEVMALVQRGETEKLAQLTESAHKELLNIKCSRGGGVCPECKGFKQVLVKWGHRLVGKFASPAKAQGIP